MPQREPVKHTSWAKVVRRAVEQNHAERERGELFDIPNRSTEHYSANYSQVVQYA